MPPASVPMRFPKAPRILSAAPEKSPLRREEGGLK